MYRKTEPDAYVDTLFRIIRIPLGNLPDGRTVYTASDGLEILGEEPGVKEIVNKYGAENLDELLYSGRFREKESSALQEIVDKYERYPGLIFFNQSRAKIPEVVEASQ